MRPAESNRLTTADTSLPGRASATARRATHRHVSLGARRAGRFGGARELVVWLLIFLMLGQSNLALAAEAGRQAGTLRPVGAALGLDAAAESASGVFGYLSSLFGGEPAPTPAPAITDAAVSRNHPSLNSGRIEGSLRVFKGETFGINTPFQLTGDLYTVGTPNLVVNSGASYGGLVDDGGASTPTGYPVTLNSNVVLPGKIHKRADALTLPTIPTSVPAPTATRTVNVNSAADVSQIGNWATVRDLNVTPAGLVIDVPPGNYGTFSVNNNSRLRFSAGTYNFSGTVNLNAGSTVETKGQITVNIGGAFNLNSGFFVLGASTLPGDVIYNVVSTSCTLNNTSTLTGLLRAPNANVNFNGTPVLTGQVIAGWLNMNGGKIVGNTSFTPPPDTQKPTVAIASPADGFTTYNATLTVSGTASDPGQYQAGVASVTVNNQPATFDPAAGTWTVNGLALALGANTITARATDGAGNFQQAVINVTRQTPPQDTVPPTVGVSTPAEGATVETDTVNVGGTVSDAGNPVSGVAQVTVNGTAAVLNAQAGTWSLASFPLAEGPNTLVVRATDAAGNVSQNVSVHVTRVDPTDRQNPVVNIDAPANNSTTYESEISVSGTATDDGQYQTGIRQVKVNDVTASYDPATKRWNAHVPVEMGTHPITAVALDGANNQGTAQINVTRQEPPDTAPPTLAVSDPADGLTTDATSLTVAGTVSDIGPNHSGVDYVKVNGTPAAIDPQAGTWSLANFPLALGTNHITVLASDHAGNTKEITRTVTRVYPPDTAPPVIVIASPAEGVTVETGTVTVTGTATDEGDNAAGVSFVKVNGVDATYDPATKIWRADGVALTEGPNKINVVATDAAPTANSSQAHVNVTLHTPDRDAPVVNITSPLGSPATYDTTVNVSGTATDDGLNATGVRRVTVGSREAAYDPATKHWSVSNFELALGENVIPVVAFDGASPAHEARAELRVTRLQIPAPSLMVSNPQNGGVYTAATMTVAGTVSSVGPGPLTVTVNGAPANVSGNSFTKTVTLVDGANTINVVARDPQGQETQSSVTVLRDQTAPAVSFVNVPGVVQPGGSYRIQVDATDNVGVAEVEFRVGGEQVGADTAAPYEFTFNVPSTLAAGQLITLTAVARDLGGATSVATAQTRTTGPGGLSGYVFDDATGYVINGALASLDGGTTSANSDEEGAYSLVSSTPTGVVRLSKAGFTPVERLYTVSPGEGTALFDARLTPLDSHANPLTPAGGAADGDGGRLRVTFNSGALPADADVRVTSVSPQGLENLLPYGWSPVPGAVVDVRAAGVQSFNAPARLRVSQTTFPTEGRALVLAYYDEQTHGWTVVAAGLQAAADGSLEADLARPGQYAFLVADVGATAPAAPTAGAALTASRSADPSALDAAKATAVSLPRSAAYSSEARSTISFVADAPAQLPSGVSVEATFDETYNFLGGKDQLLVGRPAQDFVLYSFPGATAERPNRLGAFFVAKPTRTEFTVAELINANVHVEIRSGRASRTGALVGTAGGTVTSPGGARLVVPANAVTDPQPVFFGEVEPQQANVTLPEGYEIVGAFDLDLAGATLARAASITVPGFGGDPANIVVARMLNVGGLRAPKLVARAAVVDGDLVSTTNAPAGVTLPGITAAGRYLFIRVPAPFGYATGRVTESGQPSAAARVSNDRTPFADLTGADGRFLLLGSAAAPGANQLSAAATATDATGKATATLAAQDAVATLDIALASVALAVESVTPADSAQGVVATTAVTVTFNKPVAPQTVTASNFKLTNAAGNPVLGTITVLAGGRVAVFTPAATLSGSTAYRVAVGQGVRDIYGKPLAAGFNSAFNTSAIVKVDDRLKPEKIRVNYPDDAGVSRVQIPAASVPEGSIIIAVNETSGATVTATAGSGGLELNISAQVGDQLTLIIRQPDGVEYRVSQAAYRRADGVTSVGANGGTVTTDDGRILLDIPAGAITGQADLQLAAKTEAQLTTPRTGEMNPADVPFGAAVEIKASGEFRNEKEMHVEVAVPPGTNVQEGQRVAVMKPSKMDWQGQEVDVWETVTSGKVEGGKFKTTSPPFPGVVMSAGVSSNGTIAGTQQLELVFFVPIKLRAISGTVKQQVAGEPSVPLEGVNCLVTTDPAHLAASPQVIARTNKDGGFCLFSYIAYNPALSVVAMHGPQSAYAVASPHLNINPLTEPGLVGVESFYAAVEFPPDAAARPAELHLLASTGEQPHDSLRELGLVSVGKHVQVVALYHPVVGDFKGTMRVNGAEGPPLTWAAPELLPKPENNPNAPDEYVRRADFDVTTEGSYSVEVETLTDTHLPGTKSRATLNFIALRNPNTRPPLPGPPKVISVSPADGATQVDAGAPVHLEFSEPVTKLRAGESVYLYDPATQRRLAGSITSGGIPVAPDSAPVSSVDYLPAGVAGGTRYEVNVTNEVEDSDEHQLDQDYTGDGDVNRTDFKSSFKTFDGIVLTDAPVADLGLRIAVAGQYAATVSVANNANNVNNSWLKLYDISNPTQPVLAGQGFIPFRAINVAMVEVDEGGDTFKVPGTDTEYTRLAFVTGSGLPDGERPNNLWIFNVQDPKNIQLVGVASLSIPARVTAVPVSVTVHRKRAYVANVSSQGVMVVDIEKALGEWASDVKRPNVQPPTVQAVVPNRGYAWDAVVQMAMYGPAPTGNPSPTAAVSVIQQYDSPVAYVASQKSQLVSFDLSQKYDFRNGFSDITPNDGRDDRYLQGPPGKEVVPAAPVIDVRAVSGVMVGTQRTDLAVLLGNSRLWVFNVTNPSAPVQYTSKSFAELGVDAGFARRLEVEGTLAYVIFADRVAVFDFADPEHLAHVATLDGVGDNLSWLAVKDGFIYTISNGTGAHDGINVSIARPASQVVVYGATGGDPANFCTNPVVIDRATRKMSQPAAVFFQVFGHDLPHAAKVVFRKTKTVNGQPTDEVLAALPAQISAQSNDRVIVGSAQWPGAEVVDPLASYTAEVVLDEGESSEYHARREPVPFSTLIAEYQQSFGASHGTKPLYGYILGAPANVTLTVEGANRLFDAADPHPRTYGLNSDPTSVELPAGTYPFTLRAALVGNPAVFDEVYGEVTVSDGGDEDVRLPGSTVVNGVELSRGNLGLSATDISVTGRGLPLSFTRSYNTGSAGEFGPLGYGWRDNYQVTLVRQPGADGVEYTMHGGDGGGFRFKEKDATAGEMQAQDPQQGTLAKNSDGSFDFYTRARTRYHFPGAFDQDSTNFFNRAYMGNLEYIEDPNGNRLTLAFDGEGRLARVTDSSGRALTFTYEQAETPFVGLVPTGLAGDIACTNKKQFGIVRNRFTHADVGKAWRLTKVEGPGGLSIAYEYDADGNLAAATRSGEDKISVAAADSTWRYAYGPQAPAGAHASVTHLLKSASGPDDSNGSHTTTYEYDFAHFRNPVKAIHSPESVNNLFAYVLDAQNRVTQATVTDARSNDTVYTFDEHGYVTRILAPRGAETLMGWNSKGQKEYERDPEGRVTRTRYERNNPVSQTVTGGGVTVETSTVYDSKFNKPTSVTDGNGNTTTYSLDTRGNVTRVGLPTGRARTLEYASNGDLRRAVDEHGLATNYTYDAYGNPQTVVREASQGTFVTTTNHFDERSRLTSSESTLGPTTANTYDALDRVTSSEMSDPANFHESVTQTYTYSAGGRVLTGARSGGGQQLSTAYAYDNLDRVKRRTETVSGAGQFTLEYAYDNNSNLLTETDRRGVTNTYVYDELNFRTKTTVTGPFGAPATVEEVTDMDKVGHPRAVVNLYGKTTAYEYDGLHRLRKKTLPGNYTEKFDYDADGNVTSSTDRNDRQTKTSYDPLDRPSERRDPAGHVVDWTYDDATLTVKTQSFPQGLSTTRQTDALGRPVLEEYKFEGTDYRTTYAYDGRTVRMTDPRNTAVAKTLSAFGDEGSVTVEGAAPAYSTETRYAAFGAPKSVRDPLQRTTTYTSDGFGRVTAVQLPGGFGEAYTYDGEGNVLSHTDRRGAVTETTYDNLGRRLVTKVRLGAEQVRVSSVTYDDASSKVSEKDALEHETVTAYDGLRRPVSVTNADSQTRTLTYDGQDLVEETDFKGQTSKYKYDELGRLTEARDRDGQYTTVYYNDRNGLTRQVNDRRGNARVETYDALGRLTAVTSGGEDLASFQYDGNGNRTVSRDGRGFPTNYTYDGLNRLKKADHATVWAETYDYDAAGNLTNYFDGAGGTVVQTFDELDHLKTRTDGASRVTDYRFDGEGLLLEQTDPKQHKTEYRYNALGSLVGVIDARQKGWEFAYNDDQTLKSFKDALGRTVGYSYDKLRRLKTVTRPGSVETSYDYDPNGNRTSVTDPKGQTTSVTYDALDRAKVIDYGNTQGAGPRRFEYGYDPEGNPTSVNETLADAAGQTRARSYARTYDARNRLESATDPNGRRVSYGYDADDRLKSFTDPSNRATAYEYDGAGRLRQATLPGGATVGYTWRGDGRLERVAYPSGMERRYEYDDADRLLSVKNQLGGNVAEEYGYTYDNAANRETETKKIAGAVFRQASYTYDELDRLTRVAYGAEPEKGLKGEYFDNSDLTDLKVTRTDAAVDFNWPALSSPDPSVDSETFSARWTGQLLPLYSENYTFHVRADEGVRLWVDGQLVIDHWEPHPSAEDTGTYQLTAGRKVDIKLELREETGDAEAHLSWSSQSQPKQIIPQSQLNVPPAQAAPQTALAYGYDDAGNRTSEAGTDANGQTVNHAYTYDDLNRLKKATGYAGGDLGYTYDPNGNLTGVTQAGHATAGYEYDVRDQLRRALDGAGREVGAYDYDTGRRRIGRTASGVERRYVYNGDGLAGEYDPQGVLTAAFDYGTDLVRSTLSGEGERWHFSDGLGSVTALSAVSGGQPGLATRYEYGAWGEVLLAGNSSNQFGYTGQRLDGETGLTAMGNGERYYSPALGRFIQQDSLAGRLAEVQTLNRYAYVRNNPLRFTDPTGHETYDSWSNWLLNKTADLFSFADPSDGKGDFAAAAREGGFAMKAAFSVVSFMSFGRNKSIDQAVSEYNRSDKSWLDFGIATAQVTRDSSVAILRAASFGYGAAAGNAVAGSSLGLLGRAGAYAGIGGGEQFANDLINNLAGEQEGLSSPGQYAAAGLFGAGGGLGAEALGWAGRRIFGRGGGSAAAEVVADSPQQAGAGLKLLAGEPAGGGALQAADDAGSALRGGKGSGAGRFGPRRVDQGAAEFLDDELSMQETPGARPASAANEVEGAASSPEEWDALLDAELDAGIANRVVGTKFELPAQNPYNPRIGLEREFQYRADETKDIWFQVRHEFRDIQGAPGNGRVEVRYHSPNPNAPAGKYSTSNYTTQVNLRGQKVYMLPDGTWKHFGAMTEAEKEAIHFR
ncbi:MAG: Ig-like domain-containing protein [Acidobacteria bacterium]|nr:Ig-like domain-containing protein [Acidobacteriota bacterium]